MMSFAAALSEPAASALELYCVRAWPAKPGADQHGVTVFRRRAEKTAMRPEQG